MIARMLRAIVVVMLVLALFTPALARAEIPQRIADIIRVEAERVGLDPVLLLVIAELESGGDPRAVTGSYAGVLQLGPAEFRRYIARADGRNALMSAATSSIRATTRAPRPT